MNTLVDNSVWRGPRPVDFAATKAQFKTVISLEGNEEDWKESKLLWPTALFCYPISPWQIYATGISQTTLAEIVGAIYMVPKPVLVHCQHGQDRTGLAIAAYRALVCGWTKEDAMTEALHFGYRRWINFGLNRTWKELRIPKYS